jgi:hypothetical protein
MISLAAHAVKPRARAEFTMAEDLAIISVRIVCYSSFRFQPLKSRLPAASSRIPSPVR